MDTYSKDDNEELPSLLLEFEKWMIAENKSVSTIISYKSVINLFIRFLHSINALEKDVSEEIVDEYIAHQQVAGHRKSTIGKHLNAINLFTEFRGTPLRIRQKDKLSNLEQPIEEKEVTVVSNSSQNELYKYTATRWNRRNSTIMLLILETGLKTSEIISLNKEDIKVSEESIYIQVGSDVKRSLPISSKLYTHIQHTFKSRFDSNSALFVSRDGGRINVRSIQYHCQKHFVSPQILRDTYIFNLIENDTDTYVISQLAGTRTIDHLVQKFYSDQYQIINLDLQPSLRKKEKAYE